MSLLSQANAVTRLVALPPLSTITPAIPCDEDDNNGGDDDV